MLLAAEQVRGFKMRCTTWRALSARLFVKERLQAQQVLGASGAGQYKHFLNAYQTIIAKVSACPHRFCCSPRLGSQSYSTQM
jgi:hypothetical protein